MGEDARFMGGRAHGHFDVIERGMANAAPKPNNFTVEIPDEHIHGLLGTDFEEWLTEVLFADADYYVNWWFVESTEVVRITGHASQPSITRLMALAQGHNA